LTGAADTGSAPDPPEARRALDPPEGSATPIDRSLIERGIRAAAASPRGRMIVPLHKTHADTLHRMLNVVQPGSYIRPHRHVDPPKAESLVVLAGAAVYVVFAEDGGLLDVRPLSPEGIVGMDLEPGVIHSFYATEPDTVVFEAKPGPYTADGDKSFMEWAPAEDDDASAAYLAELTRRCEAHLERVAGVPGRDQGTSHPLRQLEQDGSNGTA